MHGYNKLGKWGYFVKLREHRAKENGATDSSVGEKKGRSSRAKLKRKDKIGQGYRVLIPPCLHVSTCVDSSQPGIEMATKH